MSKEALYARIEGCRQEIAYNQKEIQKLEAKIEEYEYIRAKVVRGAENLGEFCGYQSRRINAMESCAQRVRFVGAYIEDMTGYLQGREYGTAMDRFMGAEKTLLGKRDRALEEIDVLQRSIFNLEGEIDLLEAQIREIERQEAEAIRLAEEIRMAELLRARADGGKQMYELTYDLVVGDEGVKEEAESLYEKAGLFEQNISGLVTMLEATLADAMIQGATATNLARFLEEVRSLQEEAGELTSRLKETVTKYVTEIDAADNYIY